MASVAAAAALFPSLYSSSSISRSSRLEISLPSSSSSSSSFSFLPRANNVGAAAAAAAKYHHLTVKRKKYLTRVNAAIEEETGGTTTLVPEGGDEPAEETLSIPVSRSDILMMYLKAEGTMKDSDAPNVISALEKIEGVSEVSAYVEGTVATVVLTKETLFLAKGVASELVEVIQGSGFKLQTLHLSFWDAEEDAVADY